MRLIDAEETVVVVTGASEAAALRDRPLASWLKTEIDRRGGGHGYRRAVLVGDGAYLDADQLQLHPTIAIGGPGANAVTHGFAADLPMVFSADERVFVQADLDGHPKRVGLWEADAAATGAAVDAFVVHGYLDDLLQRIWRFRGELTV